ncbi:hypothetical protein [Kitasatospora sp. NPDC059571]|uniref:DUF7848 domain-containing protein n=1 Tax=Kitasatospora sp. NPDC059571 TaxID=3346871 RepID=UPI0036D0B395
MTPIAGFGLVIGRRLTTWTMRLDDEPHPSQRHLLACLGESEDGTPCEAHSGERGTFEDAKRWAAGHARLHPDHRRFSQLSELAWVMVPDEEPE